MKLQKVHRTQAGFSLMEVVVSMFVFFVLFLLYAAALNTVAISKKTGNEDVAYHIATKQMETLREIAYTDLTNGTTSINDSLLASLPSGAGNYVISDYAGFSGMKQFVVTVTWNDGSAKQVQLSTLSSSGGINP